MNKPAILEEYFNSKKELINKHLSLYFLNLESDIGFSSQDATFPARILSDSMKYSVMAGGKRLRPILCLASTEIVGGDINDSLPSACALELIHSQSLIHDDLPSMDNDDFRRGIFSNHKKFGEPVALMAGDALLAYAFEIIASGTPKKVNSATVLKVICEIASSAGFNGICGGQVADMKYTDELNLNEESLQYIHSHKTGAIIRAAARTGIILGNGSSQQLENITRYAEYIGLAFQITDDILDVVGEKSKLGKSPGKDKTMHKVTYPGVYGLEESRSRAKDYADLAIKSLDGFGENADILRLIAEYIIERQL